MTEQFFYSVLSSSPAVTALVASRIFPLLLPEDIPLPAITYQVVSSTAQQSFSTRGMQKTRMEVNCWGASYSDAVNVRNAVIDSLTGYTDANLSIIFLQSTDFFDHSLLEYRAMAEFYIFSPL